MWLKFQAVLEPCPSHGMTNKALLECFYRDLGPENRSFADQLFTSGMLHQPYQVVANLLGGMVETNKQAQKKHEWDALVAQVDILSKQVMELEAQPQKRTSTSLNESVKMGIGIGVCRMMKFSHSFNRKLKHKKKC